MSKTFYEMSALHPHDNQTYEHMRNLTKYNLDINIIPSHLPSQ